MNRPFYAYYRVGAVSRSWEEVQRDEDAVVHCYPKDHQEEDDRRDVHTRPNMDDDREGIPAAAAVGYPAAVHTDEYTHPYHLRRQHDVRHAIHSDDNELLLRRRLLRPHCTVPESDAVNVQHRGGGCWR